MMTRQDTTLQLHDRTEFRRRIKRLELEHDELWDASKTEIHTAMTRVALENPDLLLRKLEQVQNERGDDR